MAIDQAALEKLLRERLCAEVKVEARPDGALMVRTHFAFPDGDRFPIRLIQTAAGGLRLSDQGHTLMHAGYEHDVDAFMDGQRGAQLERIMGETGLTWEQGTFCLETAPERLSESLFSFGQALTRVYDLTLLSRARVRSAFYEALKQSLLELVDEDRIYQDYRTEAPNSEAYLVDFMLEGKNGIPLFLYGIPNRDKARLATIMLAHFHRHRVKFESLLVFDDQTEIPRMDLARLSDVGGEMVSTLESPESLNRKLRQRLELAA